MADLFKNVPLSGGAVEYKLWSAEDEVKRRAALTWRQRWNEDHPNFWRKFFPWTIHRWDDPCYESDDECE